MIHFSIHRFPVDRFEIENRFFFYSGVNFFENTLTRNGTAEHSLRWQQSRLTFWRPRTRDSRPPPSSDGLHYGLLLYTRLRRGSFSLYQLFFLAGGLLYNSEYNIASLPPYPNHHIHISWFFGENIQNFWSRRSPPPFFPPVLFKTVNNLLKGFVYLHVMMMTGPFWYSKGTECLSRSWFETGGRDDEAAAPGWRHFQMKTFVNIYKRRHNNARTLQTYSNILFTYGDSYSWDNSQYPPPPERSHQLFILKTIPSFLGVVLKATLSWRTVSSIHNSLSGTCTQWKGEYIVTVCDVIDS